MAKRISNKDLNALADMILERDRAGIERLVKKKPELLAARTSDMDETWLHYATGDPPQPVAPGVKFTAFLLVTNFGNLKGFQADDGRYVNIINVVPIYSKELTLARSRNGLKALMGRFQKRGITAALDLDRPNVRFPPRPTGAPSPELWLPFPAASGPRPRAASRLP